MVNFNQTKRKGNSDMENKATLTNHGTPRMLTIRQVAATKILPEHTLRQMLKQGTLPHIMVGSRALVNYDRLIELLKGL